MDVFCEDWFEGVPGHDEHWWTDEEGVGETETVEITGSNVPHDGTYYIWVYQISGSGTYTLNVVIDRTPPSIAIVGYEPPNPQPDDTVTVTANVTDADSGVKTVTLQYSSDGGTVWSSLPMTVATGSIYTATIPKQSDGTTVQFKVSAEDNAGFEDTSTVDSYTVKALIFGIEPLIFYGIIGGLAIAILAIIIFFLMRRGKAPPSPPPPPPPPQPPTAQPNFCRVCGAPIPPETKFCPKCGREVS